MQGLIENMQQLVKALEGGSYDVAPSRLTQGAALQVEDLSPKMENVCFQDKHIKLQQMVTVTKVKSVLAQFDRQLSYGQFGGSAQLEGAIGQEETSDFVRITVPMCFYSHLRRTTLVANMVETLDGKKAEERAAEDAAKKIAGDIEFDLFRGRADFTNGGVFDGSPGAQPFVPNMYGVDLQVRQSDALRQTQDQMFNEYGADGSVVIAGGNTLTQDNIEDAATRSAMNHGSADKLVVDPLVLSNYNKIVYGKERIILAGSAQDATAATLKKQWVSGGTVDVESSRFLSGKTRPAAIRLVGPAAPTTVTASSVTIAGTVTSFIAAQLYAYYVTSVNEIGESAKTFISGSTVSVSLTGDSLQLVITHPAGTIRYFNVYRGAAGAPASLAKFVGRITIALGASTTTFIDLNNKTPGFVTGYLLEGDTMELFELSAYSRLKLAVVDLSTPEAHFRFASLAVKQPRKNVLIDNLH